MLSPINNNNNNYNSDKTWNDQSTACLSLPTVIVILRHVEVYK